MFELFNEFRDTFISVVRFYGGWWFVVFLLILFVCIFGGVLEFSVTQVMPTATATTTPTPTPTATATLTATPRPDHRPTIICPPSFENLCTPEGLLWMWKMCELGAIPQGQWPCSVAWAWINGNNWYYWMFDVDPFGEGTL